MPIFNLYHSDHVSVLPGILDEKEISVEKRSFNELTITLPKKRNFYLKQLCSGHEVPICSYFMTDSYLFLFSRIIPFFSYFWWW